MSEDRRSLKLHKQLEVEDDDDDDNANRLCECGPVCEGIPTPTVQSASSSSGTSPDESHPKVVVPPPITRKQTLIRGIALEGTSPPPESFFSQIQIQDVDQLANGAAGTSTDKPGTKTGQSQEAKEFLLTSHKVSNDSGHGTIDHNDGASDTSVLSRDSSLENTCIKDVYRDSSGVNIPKFMKETLLKSPKDRKTILLYEDQLLNFINNDSVQSLKMAEMTSYDRMIVHRLAAFLGLEHNVDSTKKCVVLSRTENTRSVKLSDLILFDDAEQEPKKKILLKKPASLDEKHCRGNKASFASIRAKSLEERQQNYNEARERIFNTNDENQAEVASPGLNLLTAHYTPEQQTQDITSLGSQHPTKWMSTELCGYGTDGDSFSGARLRASMMKTNSYGGTTSSASHLGISLHRTLSLNNADSLTDSHNTVYGSPPTCLMSSSDHVHISRPIPDTGPTPIAHSQQCPQLAYLVSNDYSSIPAGSLIINPLTMQPHVNADGSLYHFDPTCPPPFMVQPPMQQHPTHIVYHTENLSDLAARLAATSVGALDQTSEQYVTGLPGQAFPVMPAVIQPVYTTAHQSQVSLSTVYTTAHPTQGQCFAASVSQQPVRFVALQHSQGQGQQLIQATPVDGQATVPMPAVGIPGASSYHTVGPPYQQHPPVGDCLDYGAAAYHYGVEAVMVSRTSAAPRVILTYSQPAHQQHSILTSHQTTGNIPYYTVPVSTPTPPLALTQPPPSCHHHQPQQQPTIFYTSIGNPVTYPVSPQSSSTFRSTSTPFIHRPSTPPQQQIHQHHHQQKQSAMIPSSNGHHPPQLSFSYNPPVSFNPNQPVTPATQGSQLVTFPSTSCQVRPLGTALIHLPGSPVVHSPQSPASAQPIQLLGPTGSLSDVRMVNPSYIRPRLSSVQLATSQQPRLRFSSQYQQNNQKKARDSEQCQSVEQTGHASLPGCIPQLPTTSSNRQ